MLQVLKGRNIFGGEHIFLLLLYFFLFINFG